MGYSGDNTELLVLLSQYVSSLKTKQAYRGNLLIPEVDRSLFVLSSLKVYQRDLSEKIAFNNKQVN